MFGKVPEGRLALIERVVAVASRARSAPRVAACQNDFIRAYFRGVAEEDLATRDVNYLAVLARSHLALGLVRKPRTPLVKVFNVADSEQFASRNSLVAVVTDDMPFLLDSVGMVFAAAGIAVHLVVHPVLTIQRDHSGRLHAVSLDEPTVGSARESWQFFEIDRQLDGASLATLATALLKALADVRNATTDWLRMRAQIRGIAMTLGSKPPRRSDPNEIAEARALLEWMEGAHFVFQGYRYYNFRRGRSEDQLIADRPSGLGILRSRSHSNHKASTQSVRGELRKVARNHSVLVITKANAVSTIHRATYLDYVAIKDFDSRGEPCGEHRFLGLWTSTAYFASPRDIPVLRRKVERVIAQLGVDPASHDGKAVTAVLETYPRDELFQASVGELVDIVRGVVNLYELRKVRLMMRRDPFQRFHSCMVYVPRDRYTTEVRQRIEQILLTGLRGTNIESQVQISDASHARLHIVVRTDPQASNKVDRAALERGIAAAATTWNDRLRAALLARHEPAQALTLAAQYANTFPLSYQSEVDPVDSIEDIADLQALRAEPSALRLNLQRKPGAPLARMHLKIVKTGEPIPISDLLPMMENFGLRVLSEHPYLLNLEGGGCVQDFEFEHRGGHGLAIEKIEQRFAEAFLAVWRGDVENDGFNRLLLASELDARDISLLRALCRYLLQTGLPFSQVYMERVLSANASIAGHLLRLFRLQFEPGSLSGRAGRTQRLHTQITSALDAVTSADEDRILRAFLAILDAMLRTNFYQRDAAGNPKSYLSFKLDPDKIPGLPLPRPKFEIFVYSPRVEGVHLRKGDVARGGIRWSDRREDFRTEVLGLMKAQHVKNTLIVPVGAKGGFVPKKLPLGGSREDIQKEGIAAYQTFIRGLLDLTDNIVNGKIVPPPAVLRRDRDDPYLVVAADKGTATFSDIANAISIDYGFWLGDAFASGGSAGYDHKKMGITARGGWECVKRHFREMGIDTQSQAFTVAGIGDMSGDVFGNALLLSPHALLVAAFNHQHIFIDPTPDAARTLKERQRLFKLPRSGWDDYDRKLISRGGGIFERSAKSLSLSAETQKLLGLSVSSAAPNDVIKAILKMQVDLLWNGGIGTYVKASGESTAAAGDRSNDALRIDGRELRARVVGEGGNLGFTQLGRIEYALTGGRINTDFIDNSAGVNTSDVEVNLKILLNAEERAGRLKRQQRDRLLASMTDEIATLVLRNNYLQSQAISTLELQSVRRLPELQHLVRSMERSGELNRGIEYLPDEEGFSERRKQGKGLTRPELAILVSYSKIVLKQQLLVSDVPEDPYLSAELVRYFPTPVRRKFARAIGHHRLRREIIATATTNSLVNRMGPSFVLRAEEDTGAVPGQVARAYSIAREVFDMRQCWAQIEALDNRVPASIQYAMNAETSRLLRHCTYWLLQQRRRDLAVDRAVHEFAPGVQQLLTASASVLTGDYLASYSSARADYLKAAVPEALAGRVAALGAANAALDIVELAHQLKAPVIEAGRIHFEVGKALGLDWLRAQIEQLAVDGTWQAVARTGLRDAAQRIHRQLTANALKVRARGDTASRVSTWLRSLGEPLAAWQRTLTDMRASGSGDFATLTVGIDAIRRLSS